MLRRTFSEKYGELVQYAVPPGAVFGIPVKPTTFLPTPFPTEDPGLFSPELLLRLAREMPFFDPHGDSQTPDNTVTL